MSVELLETKVRGLTRWMKTITGEAGALGGVFGVSGGVDSALVLALAKRAWGNNCMGLVMPCHSADEDARDALQLLNLFSCPHRVCDLTSVYDEVLKNLSVLGAGTNLAKANLKPRLRSMTLYYQAALLNYLVVGASNKAELHVGYFTKHGDSGVDMQPLAHLTKTEVWDMARYLGVPDGIASKTPSGGLWQGQTDEEEMGLTYKDLDTYLSGGVVSEEVLKKIQSKHAKSEHKRRVPAIPDFI